MSSAGAAKKDARSSPSKSSSRGSWLTLAVSENVPSKAQVLISVPKRIVPRAVDRNRIRRLIKEVLRLEPMWTDNRVYRLKVTRFVSDLDYGKTADALRAVKS